MSEIYIHYGNLEDSIDKSKKVREQISDYVNEIKCKVTTPISNLNGSDSAGYASTASSLAWQKISALNNKSSRFSAYETSVRGLISEARSKDNHVSSRMETIAGMYIEERSWYQKASDWVYNTFCIDLANKWDWTRDFIDATKWIQDKVGNGIEKVKDWFKYGDGKYVLNIITAVGSLVASIAATIAAIVAIPFTGGATLPIVIGTIGAIATSVSLIITVVNTDAQIGANAKALSLSGDLFDNTDGDQGAAQYYGSISKVSEAWNKTDMGDAETNATYEKRGKIIDTTKVVADTVAFTCNVVNSAGAVRDYRFKNPDAHIKRYEFSVKNFKHNLRGEFGFYLTKPCLQLKDPNKTVRTINDIKNGVEYYKNQKKEVDDIWNPDESEPQTTTTKDPFEELESAWDDFKSLGEVLDSATKTDD